MRKFSLYLAFIILFAACTSNGNKPDESIEKGFVSVNLKDYGVPLTIQVPDSTSAPLNLEALNSGEITIRVGKRFYLSVAEGGDMALKKSDLESDLLYKSEIISEEPDLIVYKSELPDGKSFYHFYCILTIDGIEYEIKDMDTGNAYSLAVIEKMVKSTKTITSAKVMESLLFFIVH